VTHERLRETAEQCERRHLALIKDKLNIRFPADLMMRPDIYAPMKPVSRGLKLIRSSLEEFSESAAESIALACSLESQSCLKSPYNSYGYGYDQEGSRREKEDCNQEEAHCKEEKGGSEKEEKDDTLSKLERDFQSVEGDRLSHALSATALRNEGPLKLNESNESCIPKPQAKITPSDFRSLLKLSKSDYKMMQVSLTVCWPKFRGLHEAFIIKQDSMLFWMMN